MHYLYITKHKTQPLSTVTTYSVVSEDIEQFDEIRYTHVLWRIAKVKLRSQ